MQGEKEMKGKVSTPCQHCAGTGGGGHTDWHTYGLSDQPTRVLEFHMLYGTKKVKKLSLEAEIFKYNDLGKILWQSWEGGLGGDLKRQEETRRQDWGYHAGQTGEFWLVESQECWMLYLSCGDVSHD